MEDVFLAEVLAHPGDPGPWLVCADWLDQQDDPRGGAIRAGLRFLEAAAALPVPPDGPTVPDLRGLGERRLRLFAVACARHTPLPDGRRLGELLGPLPTRQAVAAAEAHAYGLCTSAQLEQARAAARGFTAPLAGGRTLRRGLARPFDRRAAAVVAVRAAGRNATDAAWLAAEGAASAAGPPPGPPPAGAREAALRAAQDAARRWQAAVADLARALVP